MKKGITAEVHHNTIYTSYNRKENNLPPHFRALPKLEMHTKFSKKWQGSNPKASDTYSGKEMYFGISNFQISQKSDCVPSC
jgi:hypothetical protein